MSRRKTSKPKQIEAPAKLDLAEGDAVILETVTKIVVKKRGSSERVVYGELSDEQNLSDSVEAFKETHDYVGFAAAAGSLEDHAIQSMRNTICKVVPMGASILSSSLSSAKEDIKKKTN